MYTYAAQRPIGTRAHSLQVGRTAHVYTVPVARLITAARARSYTTKLFSSAKVASKATLTEINVVNLYMKAF